MQENNDLEIDFKPLTKGLGFHHNHQAQEIKKEILPSKSNHLFDREIASSTRQNMNMAEVFSSDLERFYQKAKQKEVEKIELKKEEWIEANRVIRLKAAIFDVGIVLSITGILMAWFGLFADLDWTRAFMKLPLESTLLSFAFFSSLYIFYSALSNKLPLGSFGKSIWKLHSVTQENKIPSMGKLILKSILELTGILSLGLVLYFNLPQRVTGITTKIKKKI